MVRVRVRVYSVKVYCSTSLHRTRTQTHECVTLYHTKSSLIVLILSYIIIQILWLGENNVDSVQKCHACLTT